MPLIYKPYQANIANKAGQKLYYPRLVKFSKMVNTQKMAELIAEKAKAAGITAVVFDRGGNKYTGRVAAVADGAREGGLAL